MNPHSFDFTPVRLTTDAFPPDQRLAMWREVYDRTLAHFYGRTIGNFEIEPINDQPFRAGVTLRSLPGLGLAYGYRSDARHHRASEVAAKSSDNFIFTVVTSGVGIISQRGREATIGAGEPLLMSATEPSTSTLLSAGRLLTLSVPRAAIAPLMRHAEDTVMRPIPRESKALRLLISYVATLQENDTALEPRLGRLVAGHIHDLVAATIGATCDAMEAAQAGGIRAARLATIRADVLANLSDARLSAKTIGRRHGVSDRYVHLLFAETGQTFSRFVEEQRLQRAFALLTHPTRAVRRIGEIAATVGFPEHSTFNRAFRRRFGDTPGSVRRSRADEQTE